MATPILTIRSSANVTVSRDDGAGIPAKSFSSTLTPAGINFVGQPQLISHSAWTLVSFGPIAAAPAKVMIINLDAANTVQLAEDNAGAHLHDDITFGDFVVRNPHSGTLYAKFATADGWIQAIGGG